MKRGMKKVMKDEIKLTREELHEARAWAQDESWVKRKKYENDPEYLACVQDILDNPVFQSMDQFIQHGQTTCKTHCIQVSYMSYRICRSRNWDYVAVARAGLLHDLFLYDWHTHAKETGEHFHGFTHGECDPLFSDSGEGTEYDPAAYVAADTNPAKICGGICSVVCR